MTAKGFKECYTSNASNGSSGDHILWEDEKAGNTASEHNNLSNKYEKENGNCDKTKAERQQER